MMDNQFKKLLLGTAVVAGLGAAYFFTKSKPADVKQTVESTETSDTKKNPLMQVVIKRQIKMLL